VQTFLDIEHILDKETDRGLTELQKEALRIEATVKRNLEFHEELRIVN